MITYESLNDFKDSESNPPEETPLFHWPAGDVLVGRVSSKASSERPHFRVGARWKEGNVTRALALLFRGWAESETIIFVLHVSFNLTSQWCSSRGVQDLGVRNTTRISRGSSGGGERSGVLILCLCVFNCICVGIPMAFVGQITHECICICLIYVFTG